MTTPQTPLLNEEKIIGVTFLGPEQSPFEVLTLSGDGDTVHGYDIEEDRYAPEGAYAYTWHLSAITHLDGGVLHTDADGNPSASYWAAPGISYAHAGQMRRLDALPPLFCEAIATMQRYDTGPGHWRLVRITERDDAWR